MTLERIRQLADRTRTARQDYIRDLLDEAARAATRAAEAALLPDLEPSIAQHLHKLQKTINQEAAAIKAQLTRP